MTARPATVSEAPSPRPFAAFLAESHTQSPMRAAITAATRRPEPEAVAPLLDPAAVTDGEGVRIAGVARRLVEALRTKARSRTGGVEGLIHEYALSSQEGVALMCLAEALLRVPDNATRDLLIRDKIGGGDWRSHLGSSPSIFVNAATWGLMLTGRLAATSSETSLSASLTRMIARGGEPLIRKGVDVAMRMMGEQFVAGQTIEEAIGQGRDRERRGFRHSFDMLGEAATTASDAARYLASYEDAIHAIGRASAGRGPIDGPGISVKLSALHPRYSRQQRDRVLAELLPRLTSLARLAKGYGIGFNIDAEEADRLELSLDLLEALALDVDLAGWDGLGFVVQAYGKQALPVVRWLIDLGRRSRHRLMVRLVKGAYWDSEIKRAQVDGLSDFPVFTRKVHTDVSYLACARTLLDAQDAVFPQFATHNAQTLATILALGGPHFRPGDYEFQCLHGMGEPLYEEVVGPDRLDRPCRIYAPVGTHETLLAYLVRRLLENGANSSFVNRIADETVPIDALLADPVATVRAGPVPGAPHPSIRLPPDLFGASRRNSAGLDLASEERLADLAAGVAESLRISWTAAPTGAPGPAGEPVRNPADRRDVVGHVRHADTGEIEAALARAADAAAGWAATSVEARAACLRAAADAMEARTTVMVGLIVREAGKSFANAVGEVREAVDFLRYYAAEAVRTLSGARAAPLGPVVAISPWNFPLAIFTGQVAAALAAGNPVLAKPAEETPLVAAEAVRLLHVAGVPKDVLQLVPGAGDVGAALVAAPATMGVLFTGSTAVARAIQRQLARRLSPDGRPIPLVAETGGQNAMIVDSSALAEQVVGDVIASAFDSAGQRCSALRILCLQDDVADRILDMLDGAMRELAVGNPDRLSTDIGPVITEEAAAGIRAHVATMRGRGFRVAELPLPPETALGTFVAPTLIEIEKIADVEREVFGPVLHVLRFPRSGLERLIADINATGYGLTFGLHTRIDETIARTVARVEAGNVYVNRNIIGATVGVQPFGGSGLSGTGPKAGGPLYLGRLLRERPANALSSAPETVDRGATPARRFIDRLRAAGHDALADRLAADLLRSPLGTRIELPGPVGERNVYALHARGSIAALGQTPETLLHEVGTILVTGNRPVIAPDSPALPVVRSLLPNEAATVARLDDVHDLRGVLADVGEDALIGLLKSIAARPGVVVPVQSLTPEERAGGADFDLDALVEEVTVTTNTAAAGGNASLMAIG